MPFRNTAKMGRPLAGLWKTTHRRGTFHGTRTVTSSNSRRGPAETVGRDRFHAGMSESARKTRRGEEIVRSGKPHHEILRIAEVLRSDLIVLGVHGRTPIDRMVFGSTVEPVARRATDPVVTVRATGRSGEAAA